MSKNDKMKIRWLTWLEWLVNLAKFGDFSGFSQFLSISSSNGIFSKSLACFNVIWDVISLIVYLIGL